MHKARCPARSPKCENVRLILVGGLSLLEGSVRRFAPFAKHSQFVRDHDKHTEDCAEYQGHLSPDLHNLGFDLRIFPQSVRDLFGV